jgi:hypothetical protein
MRSDLVLTQASRAPDGDDFAAALRGFAAGLSSSDHAILIAVLNAAMGPWARMASQPPEALLDPAEAELVEQLVERAATGDD